MRCGQQESQQVHNSYENLKCRVVTKSSTLPVDEDKTDEETVSEQENIITEPSCEKPERFDVKGARELLDVMTPGYFSQNSFQKDAHLATNAEICRDDEDEKR